VFDEGHHVFDAADSAFSAELSGRPGADLRRWLLGSEDRRRSRARGLKRRIEDVAAIDDATGAALDEVLSGARALPAAGWLQRIAEGNPRGPAEAFLARARDQVFARADDANTPYGLETETAPSIDGLPQAAAALEAALDGLIRPMTALRVRLTALMEEQAADMDTALRQRIEAVTRGLHRRCEGELVAWRAMLQALGKDTPAEYVDWFSVSREAGREVDAGMHRHWIDPTIPFAQVVMAPAHGAVITSATLRDGTGDIEADWRAAEARTGARTWRIRRSAPRCPRRSIMPNKPACWW